MCVLICSDGEKNNNMICSCPVVQADSGLYPSNFMICMNETFWKKERGYVWGKRPGTIGCWSPFCCQELPTQHLKVIDHTFLSSVLSVDWAPGANQRHGESNNFYSEVRGLCL